MTPAKATTLKHQLPDAILSYTDAASIANVAAVVELKGASVALDRPQRREGNMSPVRHKNRKPASPTR